MQKNNYIPQCRYFPCETENLAGPQLVGGLGDGPDAVAEREENEPGLSGVSIRWELLVWVDAEPPTEGLSFAFGPGLAHEMGGVRTQK